MKLYDAIKEIVKLKGKDIITDSALLNYLNDYHAFEERPASKLILRDVVNGGYSDKILKLCHSGSNWTIKLKSYEHDFVDSCGYKEELVLYVFQSFAYAIELTDKKPGEGMEEVLDFHPFFDNEQLMQSDSTSTPEPKQTAESVDDTDYLKIAQDFIENGKLDTARSIAEKIVNSSSKDDENTIKATIMLGHIMRKKGQYKEALDYYNNALNAEASILNISAKELQHRITQKEIETFNNVDLFYMYCLFFIGHVEQSRWFEFVRKKAAEGNVLALMYCAQWHIDPQNHIDIFFDDVNKVREGDILYEDGSFAHEHSELKVQIGIVSSLAVSDMERQMGWKHGRVVAAGKTVNNKNYISPLYSHALSTPYPQAIWGQTKELPFPHTHFTTDDLRHMDKINSLLFSELLIKDQYSVSNTAFSIARDWNVQIPLKNSSQWYLPNWVQAKDIWPGYLSGSVSRIWTSSQMDANRAIYCNLKHTSSYRNRFYTIDASFSAEDKNTELPIVPVFSF